jgi:hypothetical protein
VTDDEQKACEQIFVLLMALSQPQRGAVMDRIACVFCPHCWRENPDDSRCYCTCDD